MKRIYVWMLVGIMMCSQIVFTSCDTADNPVPQPEPAQKLVLTGDAAVEWTKNHLDSLVNVYLADCGNKIDPDASRALLSCIGYTGLNVIDYLAAGDLIDSVAYVRLMDRAVEAGNKTIVFTMGMSGCGKSTGLRNNPTLEKQAKEAGVVYDAAFFTTDDFEKQIKKSNAKGLTPTLIYVYNDAETGFSNCVSRLITSNRVIPYPTYVMFFPFYKGRIEYMEEHYPDMPIHCLDNSHNSGGIEVSKEDAKKWDYTMDADMQNKLYKIMWKFILSGDMTDEQITAVQKPERI